VLNLFVAPGAGSERTVRTETVQGFSVKSWSDQGLNFWVVSDVNAEELQAFVNKFQAAARAGVGH
jgi:anti-sigma factor RsiW